MTTNWNDLLNSQENAVVVQNFVDGNLSGREFYARFVNTPVGGLVRGLLRRHGVKNARTLAKKALSRRNLNV